MNSLASQPAQRWNNQALWRLLWPLMIEQLLAVTIGMVDTVMVASVGESAVSGVSLVDSINILLINIFTAFATGGAVVVSQYLGRKQPDNARDAARQLIYGITAVSVVLMGVGLLLRKSLLTLIYGHIEAGVMQAAETYFWLSALSYPFIALYNAGAALFRSMGNSRVSMLVALLVNVLNITGNSLFIYVAHMGVAGAAISTLISRAVAAAVLLWLLLRRGTPDRPRPVIHLGGLFLFRFNLPMMSSILKVGIPNGLENSMFQIGKLLTARIVSGFGTAAIAGNAIATVLATFGNLPGAAIGLGLITVVGQCVGAKDYGGARRNTKKMLMVAHASMACTALLIFLFAKPVIGMFGLSQEASQLAFACAILHSTCSVFFWPQSFALPSALRAAGDVRYTMMVSIFSMWVFRVGFSFLFAYVIGLGVIGVWAAMILDWIVRGTIFLLRWRSGKWESKKIIQ